jgi:FixJ family two-component response regulator
MDVFLPGISGMSLARTIHNAKPWIRYLFVSGMAPEELVQEGSPVEGKTHFLEKPFGPDDLAKAVRAALDAP